MQLVIVRAGSKKAFDGRGIRRITRALQAAGFTEDAGWEIVQKAPKSQPRFNDHVLVVASVADGGAKLDLSFRNDSGVRTGLPCTEVPLTPCLVLVNKHWTLPD